MQRRNPESRNKALYHLRLRQDDRSQRVIVRAGLGDFRVRSQDGQHPFHKMVRETLLAHHVRKDFAPQAGQLDQTFFDFGQVDDVVDEFPIRVEKDVENVRTHENVPPALWEIRRRDNCRVLIVLRPLRNRCRQIGILLCKVPRQARRKSLQSQVHEEPAVRSLSPPLVTLETGSHDLKSDIKDVAQFQFLESGFAAVVKVPGQTDSGALVGRKF